MPKPLLGIILGIVLGFFDGLTAWLRPELRNFDEMFGIVMGSCFKGLIVGLIVGIAARKIKSRRTLMTLGFSAGLVFAFTVALLIYLEDGRAYWLDIMLPGSIVGMILGYATQRYGNAPQVTPQTGQVD